MDTFGFSEVAWQSAKTEAKAALVARAKVAACYRIRSLSGRSTRSLLNLTT